MRQLHSWKLSGIQAVSLQKRLACKVRFTPLRRRPNLIAGVDCAFSPDGQRIIAAVIVLELPDFKPLETKNAIRKVTFPYIPGLLSFREAPAVLAAVKKLKSEPDLFIIDGQGIAHPRRLGLAAHLGLFLNKPTVGCAKSRLTGTYEEPPLEKGSYSLLKDRKTIEPDTQYATRDSQYEIIGAVVRTRTNVKPVFVSVGNKCTLEDAIRITLDCTTRYRLPEPTRLAHSQVSKLRLKA